MAARSTTKAAALLQMLMAYWIFNGSVALGNDHSDHQTDFIRSEGSRVIEVDSTGLFIVPREEQPSIRMKDAAAPVEGQLLDVGADSSCHPHGHCCKHACSKRRRHCSRRRHAPNASISVQSQRPNPPRPQSQRPNPPRWKYMMRHLHRRILRLF